MNSRFDHLQKKIDDLKDELGKSAPLHREKAEKKSILANEILPQILESKIPVPEKKPEEKKKEPIKEEIKKPEEVVFSTPISPPLEEVVQPMAAKPRKPGFFERNPDLEKFIGENLANKIGIGVLVLGIGFFVKYAIDQQWINEIGRVCIGIASGGILLGIAHRLRKSFVAFSSVLVGGGIAVLYLTIALAFHEYNLFSQTAAFILMLIITAFTVVLSLGYNRMELAILGILGGFASPFMVSSGEGNYVVLFTYILILDCGMLVLAYFKKWNVVNIICYAFTIILYGTWLAVKFDGEETLGLIAGAMIFASLFYLVFFAMNIINNIKEKTAFKAIEISMVLSNAFFYYAAGMVALDNPHGENYKGLFTAAIGVFNFIFAYILYKNLRVDKQLVFLLIGLVLTFISLAAPVQLEGNYITLFWAAETALLLWLSQKSGIRLMKLASVIIMFLMVISLVMDWEQIYFSPITSTLPVIFNKGYITGTVAFVSVALTIILLKKETSEDPYVVSNYKIALTLGGVSLLYIVQLLELRHQLFEYGVPYVSQNIIIGSYNMLYILGFILAEKKLGLPEYLREAFSFLGAFAMLAFLFFYQGQIVMARNEYLNELISSTGFYFHYVLISLLLVVAVLSLRKLQTLTEFNIKTHNAYSWFYVFFFVFIASAELDHIVLLSAYSPETTISHILTQNHKIGFPILWGVASFVIIAIGLSTKKKHLRIISLTLFFITLLKLFFVDIRGISEGGKIAAFISLGVLLLVVSFMYQRLKKLILADEVSIENKDV